MRILVLIYGTHKNNWATVISVITGSWSQNQGLPQNKLTRENSQIGMFWVCLRDLASTYKMGSNQERQQMCTLCFQTQAYKYLLT